MESTPTTINETEFPEIQNAFYYGPLGQLSVQFVNGTATSPGTPDPVPFGNSTVVTSPQANYAGDTNSSTPSHRIRQLVYFGRSENIVLQDSSGNLVDANGNALSAGALPIIQQVGAIYCMDGFTGQVVWRYQTPAILVAQTDASNNTTYVPSQASREVFSSPAVARINVKVPVYTAVPNSPPAVSYILQTRLVVIVGDNNGLVYCLDAIGNRNGTSNNTAVSANDQPIFNPTAGLNEVTTNLAGATTSPHVGTTPLYWIYRPDPTQPKDVPGGPTHGTPITPDPTSDLPVPGSFGTASPVIYVDPTATAGTIGTYPGDTTDYTQFNFAPNNAAVYMGNNNGVLYKFQANGGVDSDKEVFNGSLAIGDLGYFYSGPDPARTKIPTCQPLWWMPLDGSKTIQAGSPTTGSYESIVTAPAVRAVSSPDAVTPVAPVPSGSEMIYFTSADDVDNEGRLYAISGAGPTDISGNLLTPGTTGYNDNAVTSWEFPNRYARPSDPNPSRNKVRAALGSITSSPVVFTNPDGVFDLGTFVAGSFLTPKLPTRIYFSASSGDEPTDTTAVGGRPTVEETGRIWAVEADTITNTAPGNPNPVTTTLKHAGDVAWAFPDTVDPNSDTQTSTIGGNSNASTFPEPLGAFRYSTPAIGVVQFPTVISTTYVQSPGTGTPYLHTDKNGARTDIKGQNVPMLYVGSSGTGVGQQGPRIYGLDLDGANDYGAHNLPGHHRRRVGDHPRRRVARGKHRHLAGPRREPVLYRGCVGQPHRARDRQRRRRVLLFGRNALPDQRHARHNA